MNICITFFSPKLQYVCVCVALNRLLYGKLTNQWGKSRLLFFNIALKYYLNVWYKFGYKYRYRYGYRCRHRFLLLWIPSPQFPSLLWKPLSFKQKINTTILFPSFPGVDGVGFSHKSGLLGYDFCLWVYALFSNLQVRKQAIFGPYLR